MISEISWDLRPLQLQSLNPHLIPSKILPMQYHGICFQHVHIRAHISLSYLNPMYVNQLWWVPHLSSYIVFSIRYDPVRSHNQLITLFYGVASIRMKLCLLSEIHTMNFNIILFKCQWVQPDCVGVWGCVGGVGWLFHSIRLMKSENFILKKYTEEYFIQTLANAFSEAVAWTFSE